MTQADRILQYLRVYGSITPMDAFNDLGITKLATRVSEMAKNGYSFEKAFEKRLNRFGDVVYYMRYKLK